MVDRFTKAQIREKSNVNPLVDGQSYTKQEEVKTTSRIEQFNTADDKYSKAEPVSAYQPEYPYNNVYTSLSGHTLELDDTPGAERIMEMHAAGTFHEIHPDGSKVTKIFGEDYYVVIDDHSLIVGGNLNIVVQGNANFLVKGDSKTKVDGDYDLTVNGNMITRVLGKSMHYAKDNLYLQSNSDLKLRSQQNMELLSNADMQLQSNEDYSLKTSGNHFEKIGGDYEIRIDGVGAMDAEEIYWNSDVAISDIPSVTTNNADPTGGLSIPDNVVAPIFQQQNAARVSMEELSQINISGDLPKDRVKLSSIEDQKEIPNWNLNTGD